MARKKAISAKQEKAIVALMTCNNVSNAAKVAGVGARTIYRWIAEHEAFQEAYKAARREAVHQATSLIQGAMGNAVLVLRGIMNDKDSPPGTRVSAARAVLDFGLKGFEIEELEDRISRIEQMMGGQ